jgi:transposase
MPGLRKHPGKKGGEQTGPNPVDRGRAGTKHHLLVDRKGIPLAATISAANVHDSRLLEEIVDSVEPVKGPRGRPRKRPEKLHADKGYDYPRCQQFLRRWGIKARIARRGAESSERLGRHRWVVERSFSWLYRFRRLTVRYELRADIHQALLDLACALICCKYLRDGY